MLPKVIDSAFAERVVLGKVLHRLEAFVRGKTLLNSVQRFY